jgi:hypothetical protein
VPAADGQAAGQGLGRYGQWFTRLETWAEQAEPWVTYLSRSSYMLQRGRFAADVLYYYGDDSNLTALFGEKAPDIPAGFNFDYANSDVILNRVAVSTGRLTTATGMSYRSLVPDANAKLMQFRPAKIATSSVPAPSWWVEAGEPAAPG